MINTVQTMATNRKQHLFTEATQSTTMLTAVVEFLRT